MQYKVYYDFGYKTLGPLLYGFSVWLLRELNKRNISKVFFFARDGLIIKRAFDVINKGHVETSYLEVSRRSLRVPALTLGYSLDDLLKMVGPSNMISLYSVFDVVGLDVDDYLGLLKKIGFEKNDVIYRKNFLKDERIALLFDALKEDVEKNSKVEFDALNEYVKQNRLDGTFAIVDIGWSGGMQRFLDKTLDALKIDHQIVGFYTGIADYYKRNTESKKLDLNGFLFDFSHDPNAIDCRSGFVGLYEMLFLETKGSVKRYRLDNNGHVFAERFPYEYEVSGKEMPEVKKICVLQEGSIDFVKYAFENHLEMTRDDAKKNIVKVGNTPSFSDLNLFSDFSFYDEGVYSKLAEPKSLIYYLLHLKCLKKDLYQSRWKVGFLKKLFKLPLPYLCMYNFLKKVQK